MNWLLCNFKGQSYPVKTTGQVKNMYQMNKRKNARRSYPVNRRVSSTGCFILMSLESKYVFYTVLSNIYTVSYLRHDATL